MAKGQLKECTICGYEFKVGDYITFHYTENHLDQLIVFWMHETLSTKKMNKIFSHMGKFEE